MKKIFFINLWTNLFTRDNDEKGSFCVMYRVFFPWLPGALVSIYYTPVGTTHQLDITNNYMAFLALKNNKVSDMWRSLCMNLVEQRLIALAREFSTDEFQKLKWANFLTEIQTTSKLFKH